MYEELILNLAGYQGDFPPEDMPYFHPSQKIVIEKLKKLGTTYKELKTRVESAKKSSISLNIYETDSEGNVIEPSIYYKGICLGIEEVLDCYLQSITEIESILKKTRPEETASNVPFPLSFISLKLKDFHILLPQLLSFTKEIFRPYQESKSILDLLIRKYDSTVLIVKNAIKRCLSHCNKIFMNSLISWMIYGITPPEFFIQKEFPVSVDMSTNVNVSHSFEFENKTTSSRRVRYQISLPSLPKFIPLRTAEQILFIGRSIMVLRATYQQEIENPSQKFFSRSSYEDDEEDEDEENSRFTITSEELVRYVKLLRENNSEPIVFNMNRFQETVKCIYLEVSTKLWDYLITKSKFKWFSKFVIRDFYLLGAGHFFQSLLHRSSVSTIASNNVVTQLDLSSWYVETCRDYTRDVVMVYSEDDDDSDEEEIEFLTDNVDGEEYPCFLKLFSLILRKHVGEKKKKKRKKRKLMVDEDEEEEEEGEGTDEEDEEDDERDFDVMGTVSPLENFDLSLNCPYPLNLFFTEGVLSKYNEVFRFLYILKKIQFDLQNVWKKQNAFIRKNELLLVVLDHPSSHSPSSSTFLSGREYSSTTTSTPQRKGLDQSSFLVSPEMQKILNPKERKKNQLLEVLKKLMTLRNEMSYFIDQLHFFFHYNIIEKKFRDFISVLESLDPKKKRKKEKEQMRDEEEDEEEEERSKIRKKKKKEKERGLDKSSGVFMMTKFETIQRVHNDFLNHVYESLFLTETRKDIRKHFITIFKFCKDFVDEQNVILADHEEMSSTSSKGRARVKNLKIMNQAEYEMKIIQFHNQFKREMNFLLKTLSGLKFIGPHLNELLLKVNFNNYFNF